MINANPMIPAIPQVLRAIEGIDVHHSAILQSIDGSDLVSLRNSKEEIDRLIVSATKAVDSISGDPDQQYTQWTFSFSLAAALAFFNPTAGIAAVIVNGLHTRMTEKTKQEKIVFAKQVASYYMQMQQGVEGYIRVLEAEETAKAAEAERQQNGFFNQFCYKIVMPLAVIGCGLAIARVAAYNGDAPRIVP